MRSANTAVSTGLLIAGVTALGLAVFLVPEVSRAGRASLPHKFVNGSIADADQVNANFETLATEVNDNHNAVKTLRNQVASLEETIESLTSRVGGLQTRLELVEAENDDLESQVADMESRLAAVEASDPGELPEFLDAFSLTEQDDGRGNILPTLMLTGVNLQIVNGEDQTATANGLGNLIIGYQESRLGGSDDRTGSHNVVVGEGHNYTHYAGLVVGRNNSILGPFSAVSGGSDNQAIGERSAISGGCERSVTGPCDWGAGELFENN